MDEQVAGRRHPVKALKGFQNLRKLTVKSLRTQARGTGSGRQRGLFGDKAGEAGRRLFLSPSGLVVDQPSEQFEFLRQRVVPAREVLDLAHGMQHGRVVAAAEAPPDLRQ